VLSFAEVCKLLFEPLDIPAQHEIGIGDHAAYRLVHLTRNRPVLSLQIYERNYHFDTFSVDGVTRTQFPMNRDCSQSLRVPRASCIRRGFELPFGWNSELLFQNQQEGKIHEFVRYRSAQAAAYGQ
jgi:hypothetical protein